MNSAAESNKWLRALATFSRRIYRLDFTTKFIGLSVNSSLIESAMQLAETYVLCAYDAVQLATVLSIARHSAGLNVTFVCADEALNQVARSKGLAVENPNLHN